MKKHQNEEISLQHADFVVWRVMQGKKRHKENLIRREYNMRARQRRETRH